MGLDKNMMLMEHVCQIKNFMGGKRLMVRLVNYLRFLVFGSTKNLNSC